MKNFVVLIVFFVAPTLVFAQLNTRQFSTGTSGTVPQFIARTLHVTFSSGIQKQPFRITSPAVLSILQQYGVPETDITGIPGAVENPPMRQTMTGAWYVPVDFSNVAIVTINSPATDIEQFINALRLLTEVSEVSLRPVPRN